MFNFNDGRLISLETPPYFIAEFNTSHFGDIKLAAEMIYSAKEIGVDCVKFQSWSSKTLYSETYYLANPIAKRFIDKFSLTESDLQELSQICKKVGIDFLSTPYSNEEVAFLVNDCQSNAIKIASMEINNLPFLAHIAQTGSSVILSTGMADIEEIRTAVKVFGDNGNNNLCILHCVSQYPTALDEINVKNVKMLHDEFPNRLIGFSDHTIEPFAAQASVALGARIIERHFTLDKSKIGMDNQMASEPNEFKNLIDGCLSTYSALGTYERVVTKKELYQRENMRRSLVYKADFKKGHVLTISDVMFKRPGSGIQPVYLEKYVGRRLSNDVKGDTLVSTTDF